jgi:hypothetical protein
MNLQVTLFSAWKIIGLDLKLCGKPRHSQSQGNFDRGFKGFRECGWETTDMLRGLREYPTQANMGSADTGDTDYVNAMVNHATVKARDVLKEDTAKILIR